MSRKHKGRSVPAPTSQDWGAWLARVQPEPFDPALAMQFLDSVRRMFRLGNLQFDADGQVALGTTVAGDATVRGPLEGARATLQGLIIGDVLLLSDDERYIIGEHLAAGHIVLDAHGWPVAAPACPNYPAAAVLAAYLGLALESLARQSGEPRLDDLEAILYVLRMWPLESVALEAESHAR